MFTPPDGFCLPSKSSSTVAKPLLNRLSLQFLVRVAPEQIKALFYFVIDADRCLRHEGDPKAENMVNRDDLS